MSFFKGILKYSGLFILSGWMFFIGLLVGRSTSPVEFDTGWFQERLAVIFDDSQPEESVLEKPELDFYAALQKSDLNEEYDMKLKKPSVSEDGVTVLSENASSDLSSSDLQMPIKKSRKAMTSKRSGKQDMSVAKNISDGDVIALESSSNKKQQGGGESEVENQHSKSVVARSDKTKNYSKSIDTKAGNKLSGTKSEQIADYNKTSYSYTIQIASFSSETDALNHIAKLEEKGYTAHKSSGMVGDKTWYRIRLGSFNNITEAKASLKKLEESGIKGLIIQKD